MNSVFEMKGISKVFSTVEVLHHIDFTLEKGEIRALLGANGAGKSTLMKILSGVYTSTDGEIFLDGKKQVITSPNDASELGIAIVHQELSIIPTLSVLQNFFLGREPKKNGLLDEKTMQKEYQRICIEFGFDIDPNVQAKSLSVAKQQMIEIMKILSTDAKIIIMDEPTTSLTNDEKKNLFVLIDKLKQKGKSIIYISHILDEIFRLADNATIMRNGDIVGTFPVVELTIDKISEYMTGVKINKSRRNSSLNKNDELPVFEITSLTNDKIKNVSFSVHKGEIVGLAGLVGAGRTEIVRAIFGVDKIKSGTVSINGKPVKIKSPKDAIKNGIGLIPEDRKTEGLFLKHEIYKNASIVQLNRFKKFKMLNETNEKKFADDVVSKLSIKIDSVTDAVGRLSGGNQQKVVLSKWMSNNFKLLIFDEPTKGIDVGAKEDIFSTIENMAKNDTGIIFISSDLEEVLRVADRLLIVCDGKIINDIPNESITQSDIMQMILQYRG